MSTNWKNWLTEKIPDIVIEEIDNPVSSDKSLLIAQKDFLRVATELRTNSDAKFDSLHSVSGVDLKSDLMAVYHFFAFSRNEKLILKVKVSREEPIIDSVVHLWPSADWHEREIYDLIGIKFHNHPDLRRILLPDDWVGYPLRKDYEQPTYYEGIYVPAQEKDRNTRPIN